MARVHVDTWRHSYAGIVDDDLLRRLSYERSAERWAEVISTTSGFVYVAETEDGAIAGLAAGGRDRERDVPLGGEVYGLYVRPESQRQGIGRRLVAAIAQCLLEQNLVTLRIWVLAANPARAFYDALGGRPVARKGIEMGGVLYDEVAYEWPDLQAVAALGR
jgi:GNAT superfamily N-acetyltransferase